MALCTLDTKRFLIWALATILQRLCVSRLVIWVCPFSYGTPCTNSQVVGEDCSATADVLLLKPI